VFTFTGFYRIFVLKDLPDNIVMYRCLKKRPDFLMERLLLAAFIGYHTFLMKTSEKDLPRSKREKRY